MIPMWIRRLIAILALSVAALAQTKDSAPRYLGSYTVASAPAAASWSGYVIVITDSATAGSCTSGGGSAISLCRSSGSAWVTLGGAGTTYTAGASGAITITGSTIDVDTAYVPGKTTANVFTGSNTLSGASLTAPIRAATPASSTAACTQWEVAVDASYVYVCTSTNVWKRSALSAF